MWVRAYVASDDTSVSAMWTIDDGNQEPLALNQDKTIPDQRTIVDVDVTIKFPQLFAAAGRRRRLK